MKRHDERMKGKSKAKGQGKKKTARLQNLIGARKGLALQRASAAMMDREVMKQADDEEPCRWADRLARKAIEMRELAKQLEDESLGLKLDIAQEDADQPDNNSEYSELKVEGLRGILSISQDKCLGATCAAASQIQGQNDRHVLTCLRRFIDKYSERSLDEVRCVLEQEVTEIMQRVLQKMADAEKDIGGGHFRSMFSHYNDLAGLKLQMLSRARRYSSSDDQLLQHCRWCVGIGMAPVNTKLAQRNQINVAVALSTAPAYFHKQFKAEMSSSWQDDSKDVHEWIEALLRVPDAMVPGMALLLLDRIYILAKSSSSGALSKVFVEIGKLVRSNRKTLHSSSDLCILGQRYAFRVFAAFNKELVEWMVEAAGPPVIATDSVAGRPSLQQKCIPYPADQPFDRLWAHSLQAEPQLLAWQKVAVGQGGNKLQLTFHVFFLDIGNATMIVTKRIGINSRWTRALAKENCPVLVAHLARILSGRDDIPHAPPAKRKRQQAKQVACEAEEEKAGQEKQQDTGQLVQHRQARTAACGITVQGRSIKVDWGPRGWCSGVVGVGSGGKSGYRVKYDSDCQWYDHIICPGAMVLEDKGTGEKREFQWLS
jgi:hypothetical protein